MPITASRLSHFTAFRSLKVEGRPPWLKQRGCKPWKTCFRKVTNQVGRWANPGSARLFQDAKCCSKTRIRRRLYSKITRNRSWYWLWRDKIRTKWANRKITSLWTPSFNLARTLISIRFRPNKMNMKGREWVLAQSPKPPVTCSRAHDSLNEFFPTAAHNEIWTEI